MNSGLCSQIPREQTLPLERNPLGRSVKGSSEVIDHDATVRWQMGRAVLDLVWGFIAFVVVLAVSFLTREHQDIRSFLGATCVAFCAAALLRANPRRGRLWLTVLLVASGGIVPVVTMNRLGLPSPRGPSPFHSWL
jgi:hypothetical protein